MTALVGVFGPLADGGLAVLEPMRERLASRGNDMVECCTAAEACFVAQRCSWESELDGWSGPLIFETPQLVVAADASLYYQDDLRRRLVAHGEVDIPGETGALVAAAVRLWGDDFARVLEGDMAILVWDKVRHRLLMTRDLCGRRSMYYAVLGDGSIVVASTPRAVLAAPGVPASLDLDFIAAVTAALPVDGDATTFRAVRVVPAGATLAASAKGVREVDRYAPPPFSDAWGKEPTSEDAEELRVLLERAVSERLPRRGRAAVWMSGGWDSTAVFASGQTWLRRLGRTGDLLPVSLTYPPDDPGNEDQYITSVADFWRTPVRWVDIDTISVFEDIERRIAVREDIVAHPFESPQVALARASLELGARVVLDGLGGDHLFLNSDAYLADHLLLGRWSELAHGWSRRRDRSPQAFLKTCVLPLASYDLLDWLRSLGFRVRAPLEFTAPEWMRPRPSLARASRPSRDRDVLEAPTSFESSFLLTNQYFPRLFSHTRAATLEAGVDVRSPFYDRRLMEFAARRPVNERQNAGQAKVLLRAAMRGLLPADVLTRRMRKTGIPTAYALRQVQMGLHTEIRRVLAGTGRLWLDELGIICRPTLIRGIEHLGEHPDLPRATHLMTAFQVERWLAHHLGQP